MNNKEKKDQKEKGEPQGPSRLQSPGIQGKRVPRPGSRMARGPDQVKIKVKENSSHLDEVEVLLE